MGSVGSMPTGGMTVACAAAKQGRKEGFYDMSATVFVKFQEPATDAWFDDLRKSMYAAGSHSGSSTTLVGGARGPVLSPDVTFAFFDIGKANAAVVIAKTFPFVVSAVAKQPPTKFVRGRKYVRHEVAATYEKTDIFTVTDRSTSFVSFRDQDGVQSRFKVRRDDDGNEYVDGAKPSACPMRHIHQIHAAKVSE